MHGITVVADDKIGLLADISYILGKAKVNIESLSVTSVGGKAVISLLVKDPKKAEEVLKSNGYRISSGNTLFVRLANKPGALAEIAEMLAKHKINGENLTMVTTDGKEGIMSITVDRIRKARSALKEYLVDS